jgi:ufm1-conjugating enzyme 1
MDDKLKNTVAKIPLLTINAGPRDQELWVKRLKEEYAALIKYVQINKENDSDWFTLESNKTGTK